MNCEQRINELLAQMSLEEKILQLCSQMLYTVGEDYEQTRAHARQHFRNPGHFMHAEGEIASPAEVAERINRDVKFSMDVQPHGIPPIEHGEALHGAQWGMATCFPQPIGMASTFDDHLVFEIADVIGAECAAVGVRQVLSPVINVVRDPRWGRTIETFGEDVLLTSNMGAAFCRGLLQNGVIATPKHFADNYSCGGRDSHPSDTSERTMREVYLKPFEACVKEGGALSLMAAYNSWDGVPCSMNRRLLTEILREEWGFDGFVVSDYGGVGGVCSAHHLTDVYEYALARCLKAGLDVELPDSTPEQFRLALEKGLLDEADIDRAVRRVLSVKCRIGLLDHPFADPAAADRLVRCEQHKELALTAARRSMVLLKNDGLLPLDKTKIKRLAVFGASANELPVGKNYSGPYGREWTASDVETPLQYLRRYLDKAAEVIFAEDDRIDEVAAQCDAALYFTTMVEGEGMDRADIRLPSVIQAKQEDGNAIIVGKRAFEVKTDQEDAIRRMTAANPRSAVVLLGGSPVDVSGWEDGCAAILEAWYPGEQGGRAITELLFGEINPSGKLPITFPQSVGQLPLFYATKPSGRGYGYVDNDGTPRYPFGYGLSYTTFTLQDAVYAVQGDQLTVTLSVTNVGDRDGAEVVQVYLSGRNADVVLPCKELKAYCRVEVAAGQTETVVLTLPREAFCYYDSAMKHGLHNADYTVSIGTSCTDIRMSAELTVCDQTLRLN